MPQEDFPYLPQPQHSEPDFQIGTIADAECQLVLRTLAKHNGNRTHSARVLGVSVRTLRNWIRLYTARGIEVPDYKPVDRRVA